MTLAAALAAVHARLARACAAADRDPATVELLAVSKTRPAASRTLAAELRDDDLRWHLIGSLQTNKVDQLLRVPGLQLVHSLDRVKLADALQRALAVSGQSLDVLLQVDATGDQNKHGARLDDAAPLLAHVLQRCGHLRPRGLMAMGPLAGDPRPVFDRVATLRRELEQDSGVPLPVLSLGMTGDLEAAIAAGSTLVRVGTAIFCSRDLG